MLHLGKSLPTQKLVATRWAFATAEGHPLSANVHFAPDGAITGDGPLGGDRWSIEGDEFRLASAKGQDTWQDSWRADHLYVRDGSLHVVLRGIEDPGREALLYECTPDGHRGFGGQAGLPAGEFLFPRDLQVTPSGITRVLLVGSCLTELYHRTYAQAIPEVAFDYVLFNSASDLPANPPHPVGSYDFQYLQIPLRTVLTDRIITGGRIVDPAFLEATYRDGCVMIDAMLEAGLAYNRAHGLLTFVATFIVPQLDIAASLDRRSTDGDLAYLIRRLNHYIAQAITPYQNVFLCDVDAVASSLGKRYFLDDITGFYAHGSNVQQDGVDLVPAARIEPVPLINTFYESRQREFLLAVYEQAVATYRTVRQIDQVKAVIFDLDNTLWRGLIAEDFHPDRFPWPRGGWQNGIWEAIQHLRARGILVAICSKNDHHIVEAHWDNVVDPPFLKLSDFAVARINWQPKAENVAEICRAFNLTPKSVVFVDDNPVEREAVRHALPEIRTIGSNPYLTRRILLWAPELQLPRLSAEASLRETSIRNQAAREETRAKLSREEFLAGLGCAVAFTRVTGPDQPEFPRVLELTNKTNQFNTTGRRWTHPEILAFLAEGGEIHAFTVKDKFSEYGLVGILYAKAGASGAEVVQFVMSCRVLGMEVEKAALAYLCARLRESRPAAAITGRLVETPANGPCREVFARGGFARVEESDGPAFRLAPDQDVVAPAHVAVTPEIGLKRAANDASGPAAPPARAGGLGWTKRLFGLGRR